MSNSLHICETDAATKLKFCAQIHYGRLLPADKKLFRNAAGVTEYNSLLKIYPHLH